MRPTNGNGASENHRSRTKQEDHSVRAAVWAVMGLFAVLMGSAAAENDPGLRLATFSADVTVPMGHGMMGGAWLSKSVADPLEAHGFVLLSEAAPVVFVSVDWCELRNDAYERWQSVLAEAAGTEPGRVVVTTVHQHDAPVADLEAERLLRARALAGTICDPDFHERAVQGVARALRESLKSARRFTHIGTGQARVDNVASNRRYTMPDGSVRFDRTSSTRNAFAIAADEGLIDPWLKTLSFWDRDTPLAAVSFYAVHPMSYYGQGEVSADFPGLARRKRQAEMPGVKQIYCSGCSGNVTAGKYNDGARENRAILAERLHAAMVAAWRETKRHAVERFEFRVTPLRLEPRDGPGFTVPELEAQLIPATKPFQQCLAAMGLSWRKRVDAGHHIQVPALDFGVAQLLLLPGEAYVEYQLAAQRTRPGSWVCVAGYGEGATGYIPTEKHIAERDTNLADWCWVAPGSEEPMLRAIRIALGVAGSAGVAPPLSARGIAVDHPGDAGIDRDPRVVFTENFEAGTVAEVAKRWTEMSNKAGKVMALTADTPAGSAGRRSLHLTATLGENTGGHLYKLLPRPLEKLHARFYVKFAEDAGYTHHFVALGGYNPPTAWPQGGAGERPRGDDRIYIGIEPNGDYGRVPPPGAWSFYNYWHEMKVSTGGRYWGNAISPSTPLQVPRDRWQCVEVMAALNSAPDQSDGELVLWLDGNEVMRVARGARRGPWSGMGFTLPMDGGEPFEGFRWRTSRELGLNFFWLLHYVTENATRQNRVDKQNPIHRVWFDDIVLATEYIGPLQAPL